MISGGGRAKELTVNGIEYETELDVNGGIDVFVTGTGAPPVLFTVESKGNCNIATPAIVLLSASVMLLEVTTA